MWNGSLQTDSEMIEIICGACDWKTGNLQHLHIHLTSHTGGGNYIYHHAVKTAYPINNMVSHATQTEAIHLVDNASQTDEAHLDTLKLEPYSDDHDASNDSCRTIKLEFDTIGLYDKGTTETVFSNSGYKDFLAENEHPDVNNVLNSFDTDLHSPDDNDMHTETNNSTSETVIPNKETKRKREVTTARKRSSKGSLAKTKPSTKRKKKCNGVKQETGTIQFEDNADRLLESVSGTDLLESKHQSVDNEKEVTKKKRKINVKPKQEKLKTKVKQSRVCVSKLDIYNPPIQMLHCHLCHMQCKRRKYMHNHIESVHAGIYRWQCDHCRVPFVAEGDYLHHIKQCKDSWCKCHSCSECNHQNVFLSKKLFLAHLQDSHNNVFPLSCSICNVPIASEFDEREHMSEHNKEILKCRFCETVSKSVVESEIHMMSHVRDNPYTCYICDKEYHKHSSSGLRNSIRHAYTHFDDDGGSYVCELCGESFAHSWNHNSHARICKKRFLCKTCGKYFSARSDLRQHENTHDVSKKYVCDQCGKPYAYKRDLYTHVEQVHSDTTRYKCSVCDKAFKASSCLYRHVRTHTNAPSHACVYCDKKFRCKSNLKAHTRQHTGTKPYVCTKCGLAFTHNVSRKNHEAKCTDGQVSKI